MVVDIRARLRRASPPFYEAAALFSEDIEFANRGGRKSLVAVQNQADSDFRLKIWLKDEHLGGDFRINNVTVNVPHVRDGFHQGAIDPEALEKIIRPPQPEIIDIPTVDVCIETVFDPDNKDGHGNWKADVSALPDWMSLESLTITPPETGGSAHGLYARFDDDQKAQLYLARQLFWWRINEVWCCVLPAAEPDRNGMCEFRGLVWIQCDIPDLDVIRGYGSDGVAPVLENEPMRPRTRAAVKKVYRSGNVSYEEGGAWMEDVENLVGWLFGMGMLQGQLDFHTRQLDRTVKRIAQLETWIANRFKKRAQAYQDYEINDWIQEVGGKPAEWQSTIHKLEPVILEVEEDVARFQTKIQNIRGQYNEAIDRIEVLEEKYADEIADLYVDD